MPQLSNELWASIFSILVPDVMNLETSDFEETISQFQKMRMVSTQFCEVFEQHLSLSRSISVVNSRGDPAFDSLLHWLKAVEQLKLSVDSDREVTVLSTLLSRPQYVALNTLHGVFTSPPAMRLLAGFHSLHTCHFVPYSAAIDVAPLQSLPYLSHLHLTGFDITPDFLNVHTLSHVTTLTLECARIGADDGSEYGFVSTLQHLKMVGKSDFEGVQGPGLAACQMLKSLTLLDDSLVTGAFADSSWRIVQDGYHPVQVPSNMSSLTQLTALHLHFPRNLQQSQFPYWIWQLSRLQRLLLYSACNMEIGPSLTMLSQLTYLELRGDPTCEDDMSDVVWKLTTKWSSMRQLRAVVIVNCRFDFRGNSTSNIFTLVHLRSLETLDISWSTPANWGSFLNLTCLMRAFAQWRPDVSLQLSGKDVAG